MPKPILKKMPIITKDDCVNAVVIAVPTKGAEQGVANTVAKKPLKKSLYNKFVFLFDRKIFVTKYGK